MNYFMMNVGCLIFKAKNQSSVYGLLVVVHEPFMIPILFVAFVVIMVFQTVLIPVLTEVLKMLIGLNSEISARILIRYSDYCL